MNGWIEGLSLRAAMGGIGGGAERGGDGEEMVRGRSGSK